MRDLLLDWLIPVAGCSPCLFLGLFIGLRHNRPQPAIPQELADTLGRLKAEVTVMHELAGDVNRRAYFNTELLQLLRQRVEGRHSVCPHSEVIGTNEVWVGVGDDCFCQVCRPLDRSEHFVHQDDPDGTRHGVYAGKDGWYAAIDQISVHRLRVKYGSETCDICGKDTP